MTKLFPFFKIIRPINAVLVAFTVFIGFWLSYTDGSLLHLGLLITAALCALGFGNVINDIMDLEGDKVNHPDRPLPSGQMTKHQAILFCWILAVVSLLCSLFVSTIHFIGTFIPIVFLTIYSLFLKGTPLLGNILVSLLVSYPLLFGGMYSNRVYILVIPAILAFLLNFNREIVKDIQDKKGDLETGLKTTAILQERNIVIILMILGFIYVPFLLIPFFSGHFHRVYLLISVFIIIPLHLYWLFIFFTKNRDSHIKKVSLIIKLEMLCGLLALVIDKLVFDIQFL